MTCFANAASGLSITCVVAADSVQSLMVHEYSHGLATFGACATAQCILLAHPLRLARNTHFFVLIEIGEGAMRVLGSFLLIVLMFSGVLAQEIATRALRQETVEGIDLSEIDPISELETNERDGRILPSAFEALKEGNHLWRAGEMDQSAVSYQRAINLDPTLYAAQFNLGFVLLRTNQYARAELALRQALTLRPQSAAAWQCLGFAHYYQKHYTDAVEAFRHAQRLVPDQAVAQNNLGFAYIFANRYEEAVKSFEDALRLDPGLKAAGNGLCTSQALMKESNAAVKSCFSAAASDPNSAVPHYFLGITYLDLGEPLKAVTVFETAARLEPQTARIYVGLGFACLRLGRYKEALKHFEHARKLNTAERYALAGMGAAYAQLKDYRNAESTLTAAISSDPEDATARFNLGLICLAQRKHDCALAQYNYLKIMGHSLAATLFTAIFRDRVVDASQDEKL